MAYLFPERKSQPGSAERNSQPIALAVSSILAELTSGRSGQHTALNVLEIGSGQGIQLSALAAESARQSSVLGKQVAVYQPTEADEASLAEIQARCMLLDNVLPPQCLEIENQAHWQNVQAKSASPFDVVLVFNVIHIVPWPTVEALFAQLDSKRGILKDKTGIAAFYGAFHEDGKCTSEGNGRFEQYLKAKDVRFGLRDIHTELLPLAKKHNMSLTKRVEMPAGNVSHLCAVEFLIRAQLLTLDFAQMISSFWSLQRIKMARIICKIESRRSRSSSISQPQWRQDRQAGPSLACLWGSVLMGLVTALRCKTPICLVYHGFGLTWQVHHAPSRFTQWTSFTSLRPRQTSPYS